MRNETHPASATHCHADDLHWKFRGQLTAVSLCLDRVTPSKRTTEQCVSVDEYYRRLNLPCNASPSDIKRAYRRLRAQYHPDRNKGRESMVEPVFKRIQEAFEILTGERSSPVRSSMGTSAQDHDKEARSRARHNAPPMRGANCLIELFVPLEAAIYGGEIEASYPVKGPCQQCQEMGSPCMSCHGSGLSAASSRCLDCDRTGRPPTSETCPTCLGMGRRTYRKSEVVKVPQGAWDGQRLVVEGSGHPGTNGGPPGDAIFSVVIVCDTAFRRNGLNLACDIHIDFVTATLGGNFAAQILGHALQLEIPPNANAGTTIRLPGHGLTHHNGSRGDLTLHLVLAMPSAASHLSDNERQTLREMFEDAERRAMHAVPALSQHKS
ncbi:molecular chaperone DnaJ [Paraburkholderia youngii]|uniref:DnaJ C-terminal domain-containing protein n=1 Tax=Paraburkholderia youngii TaxID=2782701 RepID=UPI003D206872